MLGALSAAWSGGALSAACQDVRRPTRRPDSPSDERVHSLVGWVAAFPSALCTPSEGSF